MRIGEKIKALRQSKGWSQKDLAVRSGKPQSYIARLENPKHNGNITLALLKDLARAFGLRVNVEFIPVLEYRIVGYKKQTEHAIVQYVVDLEDIRHIIDPGNYDHCYLTSQQALEISTIIGTILDYQNLDFYLIAYR